MVYMQLSQTRKVMSSINVITWDANDVSQTIEMLDKAMAVQFLINRLKNEDVELSEITTEQAVDVCKLSLMGEYHGIIIKDEHEMLIDSEVYLLTWHECIDGGLMEKIDLFKLKEIAKGELFNKRLG
jgi:hypothetical protein